MAEIDPTLFLTLVKPPLAVRDMDGLLALLRRNWTPRQIATLLTCEQTDARKVAALALGLLGSRDTIDDLARQLHDSDPVVNEMAEHALWSIWFRCSAPEANNELARGSEAVNRRDFFAAHQHFRRALEIDPDFAEAYNQRALAHYLQEDYNASIADGRQTVRRMACHFGAWSGLGHCYAHLGRLSDAIAHYEKALEINPHLSSVREAVAEIRKQIQ